MIDPEAVHGCSIRRRLMLTRVNWNPLPYASAGTWPPIGGFLLFSLNRWIHEAKPDFYPLPPWGLKRSAKNGPMAHRPGALGSDTAFCRGRARSPASRRSFDRAGEIRCAVADIRSDVGWYAAPANARAKAAL